LPACAGTAVTLHRAFHERSRASARTTLLRTSRLLLPEPAQAGERTCCADKGAQAAQKHAKKRIKQLGLSAPGKVRINKAGCLERCEEGPVVVIYPQGTWYTYVDNEDIDEIIDSHIVGGKVVDRLKI
jgi:(2Fe-2S) ferredoxin